MNVRINEADAVILRRHLRSSHRSLFDGVIGPLDGSDLDTLPIEVLAVIHEANHMVPWRDHHVDTWKEPSDEHSV